LICSRRKASAESPTRSGPRKKGTVRPVRREGKRRNQLLGGEERIPTETPELFFTERGGRERAFLSPGGGRGIQKSRSADSYAVAGRRKRGRSYKPLSIQGKGRRGKKGEIETGLNAFATGEKGKGKA